ncbi:MAG: hypothetical protein ABI560_14345 [Myxococcales bacterium]
MKDPTDQKSVDASTNATEVAAAWPDRPGDPFGRLAELELPSARPALVSAGISPVSRTRRTRIASSPEETAARVLRRVGAPAGLDPEALNWVWTRLETRHGGRARNRRGTALRWAAAGLVLSLSGAVVGAEVGVWKWPAVTAALGGLRRRAPIDAERSPPLHRATQVRRNLPAAPATTLAAPGEGPPPPPVAAAIPAAVAGEVGGPTPVTANSPALRARRTIRGDAATGVVTSGAQPAELPTGPLAAPAWKDHALAEESSMLATALTRLRKGRDPDMALAELDRYSSRFPSGLLRSEATSTRVEALLIAGRLDDARRVLAGQTLGSGARDREMLTIRAELTARTDCVGALRDFETVLGQSSAGPLGERALWGRAACRVRLGNEAGAQADLSAYLARFPAGAHAARARERLRK